MKQGTSESTLRDAFEASALVTEKDTSRADAWTKSLNEPIGTAMADDKAKLEAVSASLLDVVMSEFWISKPNFRRSVTVTRRICVGNVS